MSKKNDFTPHLIGRNQEAINEQLDNWEYVAGQLKKLSEQWKVVFRQEFTLKVFKELLLEKNSLIERYLKIYFINLDKKFARFASKMKIEVALQITEYPEFGQLPDLILRVKEFARTKIPTANFDKWIEKVFEDDLQVPEELKNDLEKEFTYYTSNIRENLALILIRKWCDLANLINDMGGKILPHDMPKVLRGYFSTGSAGKKYESLDFHHSEDRYFIQHLVPGIGIRLEDSAIYNLMRNLTDDQVAELYSKLSK